MRNVIEASKSNTLFTLDISEPVDGPDGRQCEVVYSSHSHIHASGAGRMVITHQQAEQVRTAIGCILFATKP